MALKTTDTKEAQDSRYNPGDLHAAEQFPEAYATHGADQAEAFANDSVNHDSPVSNSAVSDKNNGDSSNKNIDSAKNQEQSGGGWKNSFSGNNQSSSASKSRFSGVLNIAKRKGPMGLIIAALIGGGGFFSGAGLAILPTQAKEAMFGSLDDQLGAMSLRTDHVLKARLSGMSPKLSICTGVKIRCKFTTMSDKQLGKFKDAGFDIKSEASAIPTRNKITGFTTPDGTKISDPGELTSLAKKDPDLRSSLHKAYNPKFAGYDVNTDSIAKKVFDKLKTDKTSKIVGATDAERDKAVDNATSGDKAFSGIKDKNGGVQDKNDGQGRFINDSNGNPVYENKDPAGFKGLLASADVVGKVGSLAADATKAGVSATDGVFKTGAIGVLSIDGYADTACTIYNSFRAVAAAAKVTRALQLAQFAMVFFNEADKIKAGDAKPEDVNYVGNKLTALDLNKQATDESTITGADPTTGNIQTKPVNNPDYGKSALDSQGYKTAAYNEAPTLSSRAQKYMIGGGFAGTLSNVMDTIAKILNLGTASSPKQARDNIKSTCKTVQSMWARTAGLIGGIAASIGSFGLYDIAKVGVQIGISVIVGFAMPFVQAQLADIIAGTVVNHLTANVDLGNAMFAGGGALMGDMAKNRGLKPADKAGLKNYMAVTDEVKSQDIATETYEAKNTPFDIYKQYSFLGSLVRKINPTVIQATGSITAAITSIPTFLGTAFSSLIPQARADQVFNEDRYSKCPDQGYSDIGIDADVFCNVRYDMPTDELNADSTDTLDYMINNKQIDTDTGAPIPDSDYANWQKECTDRTAGWGESDVPDDNNGPVGADCLGDGTNGEFKKFRVYNVDNSINGGMDGDPATTSATAAPAAAAAAAATPGAAAPTPTPGLDPITTTYTGTEARRLAGLLAVAPNITWLNPQTVANLQAYSTGATVYNACNEPMGISPYLSSVLMSLTKSRYKISLEDIGFPGERSCETGTFQHPKGNAVDIQELSIVGGASASPGIDTYDAVTKQVTSQFATDFLALMPTDNGQASRGGIGQGPCGVVPTFPPNSVHPSAFADSCDHLHVDVRNWNNLYEKIDPLAK